MKTKRVLLTGSAGFVGRHFAAAFEDLDVVVTEIDIVDRLDVRDFFRLDETRYDLVVHLAAVVGGRAMIEGAPLAVAADLAIDSDLFRWALRTRPDRLVYYSSSAAYPVALQEGPIALREDALDLSSPWLGRPDLTYGWAKLSGELLAEHAAAEGIRVHVFRPFSGYGADQDPAYPFRALLERARRREDPFEIWGTGEQVRDFVHVEDVVAATLEAVVEDIEGPTNLCTGRATSFLELAEIITSAAGYHPTLAPLADRPTGVSYRVGDPAKMLEFFTPTIALEDGVADALG